MASSTLWDQLVQVGRDLAVRLSSQERAVRNARGATTELSRARVERDAVELFLADHEEERQAALELERDLDLDVPLVAQQRHPSSGA
ncbi:hypothetical protein [Nocardioides marmoribigeumensis]|uniref:Uncharacterized protein n=1 Tax=Nocardioides marmoribigeumensis TaxID=433649 RepID=A0ABU2BT97_9ACTN|nr:hypothetical protein [Nocardioides marmoribigeumensis]MDR7361229.1 hypothetical protein [Nocardioides marmoribigeumensis]